MTRGMIAQLPRARALVPAALLLFFSSALVSLPAGEKTTGSAGAPVSKEERLKERDRYGQETARLRREGKIQEAIEACEKMLAIEREVLGDLHDDVVGSLEQLAGMHEALGDFEAAEKDLGEVLSIQEKLHGKEDWRATDARLDLKDLRRRSELDPQERSELKEARKLNTQVFDLWEKGRSSEALPLAKKALEIRGRLLGKENRDYVLSLFNLGAQYEATRDFTQAEEAYREVSEIRKKMLGEAHPDYLESMDNLFFLYRQAGKVREAIRVCDAKLALERGPGGAPGAAVANTLARLAGMHEELGEFDPAEACRREILEIRNRLHGEKNWRTTDARLDLQDLLYRRGLSPREREELREGHSLCVEVTRFFNAGRSEEALPLAEKAVEILSRISGKESRDRILALSNLACQHSALGELGKAEEVEREVLAVREKILGKDHPHYALDLENLAKIYGDRKEIPGAVKLFEEALEIRKRVQGEDDPETSECRNKLGRLYGRAGDYAKAEKLFREAFDSDRKRLRAKRLRESGGYRNLVALYGEIAVAGLEDKGQESIDSCRKLLALQRAVLGDADPDVAKTLATLAALHENFSDLGSAESCRKVILEIRKKLYGEKDWRTMDARLNLEDLARRRSLSPRERKECEEGYSLSAEVSRLFNANRSSEALPLAERAVEIFGRNLGKENRDYAGAIRNLACQYFALGRPEDAARFFREELEIRIKVQGEEHPDCATAYYHLGGAHHDSGRFSEAIPLVAKAVEISEKTVGSDHPEYVKALGLLASLYKDEEDFAKAEELFEKAISHQSPGEDADDSLLNNLGTLYLHTGQYEKAESTFRRVVDSRKEALGEGHPEYAQALHLLAHALDARNDAAQGQLLLKSALGILRDHFRRSSALESEEGQLALARRFLLHLRCYVGMAIRSRIPAEEVYRETLSWKGSVFLEQRSIRLGREAGELAPLFDQLDAKKRQLGALLFTRDRETRKGAKAEIASLGKEIEAIERDLSRRSAAFRGADSFFRRTPEEIRDAIPRDAALIDFLAFEHWTYREKAAAAEPAAAGKPATSAEPAAPGRQKPAAGAELNAAAFVIRPGGPVAVVDLGPLKAIEEAIDRCREAIGADRTGERKKEKAGASGSREEAGSEEGGEPAGDTLRRLLWQPLEGLVGGARLVLVCPDAALGRFPLAALPGSKPGTYLIDEISIALLPVPQVLPELLAGGRPSDAAPSLFLVGDVDFDAESPGPDLAMAQGAKDGSSAKGSISRGSTSRDSVSRTGAREAPRGGGLFSFKPLDSTRGEVLMVADTFEAAYEHGKVSRLRGRNATEAAVREAAPQHRFLHLATHGFFAPDELKSALAPSEHRDAEKLDASLGPGGDVSGWHPGLLSGIVLAGVNRMPDPGRDDGILTALELATLDLERTELMVLSACETGLGATAGGEGLLGLQRAAQMAGARTVIASLWKVDDIETQALMARFYQNLWVKKMPKLEALRDAQLAMLHGDLGRGTSGIVPRTDGQAEANVQRASPQAWAAWVLSGDWR